MAKYLRGNNDSLGWAWEDVFPYFKEMENNTNINNKYHGKKGNLKVSNSTHINELTYDFIKTVNELGIPLTNDFNGEQQKGVGLYQFMNSMGKRCSAAYAFIEPQKNNRNLDLKLQTKVQKIIIKNDKAIGVEYKNKNGELLKQFANKEVIITSGSFITPKLLMLSGIGNRKELSKVGIDCLIDLPGVGENLIDHPECPLIARANGKYGYYKQSQGWRMLKNGLQFLLFGTGPVNSTGVEAGAFINPINQDDLAYIQAFFVPKYLYEFRYDWNN
jgi:Choline dehydrogenase and related flavoproteins